MPRWSLIPHPDHPPRSVDAVTVDVSRQHDGRIRLDYVVTGGRRLTLPAREAPARADDLWRTTCFELFFRASGQDRYVELNFSPSTRWAAYGFRAYRADRRDLALASDPEIHISTGADATFHLAATLDAADTSARDGRLGLSAVIEEADGIRSFWALAHAPGAPDFHDPACFVATLPAPAAP